MYPKELIAKNLIGRGAHIEGVADDGLTGVVEFRAASLTFIFSFGGDWEHLSVSCKKRTPTWDEMCFMKDIFWGPGDACIQYHPARQQHVNIHPYCLHLWRPIKIEIPMPPICFV